MGEAETRLRALLDERIVVLDGAWACCSRGAGSARRTTAASASATTPREVKGDPRPAQPHAARRRVRASTARTSTPARTSSTTNTFTATSIGQADYGLESAVYDMNVEGARLAEARRRALEAGCRFVAGSVGPLNVTLSLSPKVEDPVVPRRSTSTACTRPTSSRSAALRDGGVDLLLIETIFDTLNAKAAIAAAKDARARAAALDLGHRSSIAAAARSRARPSRRSGSRSSTPSRSSSASTARSARPRCGRTSPTSRASRRPTSLPSERRPPERLRRLRRGARDDAAHLLGEFAAARAWSTSSAAAAARRRSTRGRSPTPCAGLTPRMSPRRRQERRSAASSRSASGRTRTS